METNQTSNKYEVVTFGRNHYVTRMTDRTFDPPVPFTSKRRAQERCDEKNARAAK